MPDAFIYDAVRTPFGRFHGALAGVRPDDLAATVVQATLDRSPGMDPAAVDEVVLGLANGAGEDNRNVGRMAALLAGLPASVPGSTVNRLCGSSLDAAMSASRMIETGDARLAVAGGVESMTRAPWVLPNPEQAFPAGDFTAVSTALGWRLVNPKMPAEWTVSLGEANELLQQKFAVSRERQDEFALRSHRRAAAAWSAGFYDGLTVAVPGVELTRDESIRTDTSLVKLARLKPAFRPDGTITAGNASPLNDGASAVLIGSEPASAVVGRQPLARIAGRGAFALDPEDFGYAPVEAANQALRRAGIRWDQVGAVELNEAYAVQSLACIDGWKVDPGIVNTRGGAIAIGHPLGASGGRLLGTLAEVLRRDKLRWGVAAICHRRRPGTCHGPGEPDYLLLSSCWSAAGASGYSPTRAPDRLHQVRQRMHPRLSPPRQAASTGRGHPQALRIQVTNARPRPSLQQLAAFFFGNPAQRRGHGGYRDRADPVCDPPSRRCTQAGRHPCDAGTRGSVRGARRVPGEPRMLVRVPASSAISSLPSHTSRRALTVCWTGECARS